MSHLVCKSKGLQLVRGYRLALFSAYVVVAVVIFGAAIAITLAIALAIMLPLTFIAQSVSVSFLWLSVIVGSVGSGTSTAISMAFLSVAYTRMLEIKHVGETRLKKVFA